jgi:hypothetical protein
MSKSRIIGPLIAAIGVHCLCSADAGAQLPIYTLPRDDFMWHWGEVNLERRFGTADIEITGNEASFTCELKARMRPSTTVSPTEIRDLEMVLRTRLDFIYAVSETMNNLEYARALDWATLDCKKYDPPPTDPDTRAERESEARDKMLRELERRRAREQRDKD